MIFRAEHRTQISLGQPLHRNGDVRFEGEPALSTMVSSRPPREHLMYIPYMLSHSYFPPRIYECHGPACGPHGDVALRQRGLYRGCSDRRYPVRAKTSHSSPFCASVGSNGWNLDLPPCLPVMVPPSQKALPFLTPFLNKHFPF